VTSEPLDLGHGVRVTFFVDHDGGERVGLIFWHKTPAGAECDGGPIRFDIPANAGWPGDHRWQVNSMDPLDLSPSLLCNACGTHGFIRAGRWVPA
jgi:hypothetical protein